jgi:hypothetical protein
MGPALRLAARALPFLALSAIVLVASRPSRGQTPASSHFGIRVEASDERGLALTYTAPPPVIRADGAGDSAPLLEMEGHHARDENGHPVLPAYGRLIAVPEGTVPRLAFWIDAGRNLPGVDQPAPVDVPIAAVTLEETGRLRHHRVAQLTVRPVRHGTAGVLTLAESIRIRIDFVPQAAAPAAASAPVGTEPAWEETYRRLFLNYEAARAFRSRPLPAIGPGTAAAEAMAFRDDAGDGAPEFRILVGKTGLYALRPIDLAAQGWPSGVPIAELRLFEKSLRAADPSRPLEREVPIVVEESGGEAGLFDADDRILFYGLDRGDRFGAGFGESRFSHIHTYWLSLGAGPRRMEVVPGWSEAGPFTTPQSFVDLRRYEEDRFYSYDIPPQNGGDFPAVDTHYWLRQSVARDSLEFDLPDIDPAGRWRLRARWQGTNLSTHIVSLKIPRDGCAGDSTVVDRASFGLSQAFQFDSGFVLPAATLAPGCRRLKIEGSEIRPGLPEFPGSGAWFDWFEVAWPRRYVARDGRLRFTNGSSRGPVEIVIRGLPAAPPLVVDVTDSLNPAVVDLENASFVTLGGRPAEYELRFRTQADRQKTWIVVGGDAIPSVTTAAPALPPDLGTSNIVRDDSRDAAFDTGADVLVLTHPAFEPALAPWVAHRTAQGHRVRVVTAQDVWNQFSGGDKSVPAIRAWLRWVHRNWSRPPDYLLLFGDASEDYRHRLTSSDPDWVPTMTLYGPVPGQNDRLELVGSDNYYVGSLAAGDSERDVFPEMHVGRLPVGSMAEATAVIDKILAYEQFDGGDDWRNRGLLVSDDSYSSLYLGSADYCWRGEEITFQQGADSLESLLEGASCGGSPLACEQFRLGDYLDAVPALGRVAANGNCPDVALARGYTKEAVVPAWVARASQGHLFNIYSGHGSRVVLASETLVEFNGFFTSIDNRTPELLTNYGKPFIFIALSCHVNEYEFFQERESEHSIGESMLLLPGRGAIASIGSTGYEYTGTNLPLQIYLGKTLFSEPIEDPLTGRPGRILGAAFDEAFLRLTAELGGAPVYRNTLITYCLLGDPLLRVDRSLPGIELEAGGAAVPAGGSIVSAPGGDTVTLTARLFDDVDTGAITIVNDGVAVPAGYYEVTPIADSTSACGGARLTYTTRLEPATYSILLTVHDWLGRTTEFPVQVSLGIDYRQFNRSLADGTTIPGGEGLEIVVTSPVPLAPGRLGVRVNGTSESFAFEPFDSEGRTWVGRPERPLPEGAVAVETTLDGQAARSPGARLSITVDSALTLRNVAFYPSPWRGEIDGGRFLFEIGQVPGGLAGEVVVSIFSVSGRRVRTLDGPALPGPNALPWDMKDSRGNAIANGVYLFRLSVANEPELSVTDRLVIHR